MKKLLTLALALILIFALAACGDTGGGQGEVSIVNASEEAWVSSTTNIAYIFHEDGNYESYSLVKGVWETNGNGTYKMQGGSLTIDSTVYAASVEGNTLTFTVNGNDYAYEKTSSFNPGQPSGGGEDGLDEKLVLTDGQAWVWNKSGLITGYVFKADGTYSYHATDSWALQSSGTWSTNGSTLTLTSTGDIPYTYVINGDGLTLTSLFDDVYGPFVAQPIPSGN